MTYSLFADTLQIHRACVAKEKVKVFEGIFIPEIGTTALLNNLSPLFTGLGLL